MKKSFTIVYKKNAKKTKVKERSVEIFNNMFSLTILFTHLRFSPESLLAIPGKQLMFCLNIHRELHTIHDSFINPMELIRPQI